MKVLLTLWISAVLIQEVVPSTLVRYPRHASNASSFLHTEYEAKIEQKGKHGNESFGTMSGNQAIEHDNCNDNWNAFANKCAALIKDLVASLANAVSSKPGDATNLQLHIKNTFRHFDKTHNCSCLNQTGKGLSDVDLSHLFDNLTLSTIIPAEKNYEEYPTGNENLSPISGVSGQPKKLAIGTSPENEVDPNSTSNNRRQIKHEADHPSPAKVNDDATAPYTARHPQGHKGAFHPFLTTPLPSPERSDSASEVPPTVRPLYHINKNSPPESSSSKISSAPIASDGFSHSSTLSHAPEPDWNPTSLAPLEIEPTLGVISGKNGKPSEGAEDGPVSPIVQTQTSVPTEYHNSQNPETGTIPLVKTTKRPKSEKHPHDYSKPVSDPLGHATSVRPKPKSDALSTTDPLYESPHFGSPTETSKPSILAPVEELTDNRPTEIPVTNYDSNIPESAEPITSHNSLSSGQPSPHEKPSTRPVVSNDEGGISDLENKTPAFDKTNGEEAKTIPIISPSHSSTDEADEILITPRPATVPQLQIAENQKHVPQKRPESVDPDFITDDESPLPKGFSEAPSVSKTSSTFPPSAFPSEGLAVSEAPVEVVIVPNTSEKPQMHGTTEKCSDEHVELTTMATVPEFSGSPEKWDDGIELTKVPIIPVGPSERGDGEPLENEEDHLAAVTQRVPVGTTEKSNDVKIESTTVAIVLDESSKWGDREPLENEEDHLAAVTQSLPVGDRTAEVLEENEDHPHASEKPALVQPTTFQTTSEDPTQPPLKLVPIASTPQDSDEGTTSASRHDKHHDHGDDDDDEDDCCSCESCTEEEGSDPTKVRENVCRSLEEARKELKMIFNKIKKKLRCCRKMPHTITTLPQ